MASCLTVLLLSCWLAGWSGVSGDSFHMRGGGCHWKDARLAWWGQGLGELPRNGEPHSGGPTDRGEGGSYSCQYSTKWDSPVWSEPSDPVLLVVADSFHMWGGGCHWKDARIAWWGQGLGELPRNGQPHSGGPTDGGDGGSYSCQYSTKWDSPVWSEPSDPVQLVVAAHAPGGRRRWFYSRTGNPTDSSGNDAGSHLPRQHGTRYQYWGQEIAINPPRSRQPMLVCIPLRELTQLGASSRTPQPTMEPAGEGAAAPLDFTNANIARLVLGTVVLLILGLILDLAVQGRESPRG
ncbi:unnamed protein product [Eretmochelys imbricata]